MNIISLRNAGTKLGVLSTGASSVRGDKCGKGEQEGKKKFLSQLEGCYYTVGNNKRPFFFVTPEMY